MRLVDADKIIFREIDEVGGEYEPYLGCSKSQIDSLPPVTPQEPRWIPVSERLPEPDVEVLVTDDAGGLATISTDSIYESEVTGEKKWYTSQNVTAWMFLPQVYREVEE